MVLLSVEHRIQKTDVKLFKNVNQVRSYI